VPPGGRAWDFSRRLPYFASQNKINVVLPGSLLKPTRVGASRARGYQSAPKLPTGSSPCRCRVMQLTTGTTSRLPLPLLYDHPRAPLGAHGHAHGVSGNPRFSRKGLEGGDCLILNLNCFFRAVLPAVGWSLFLFSGRHGECLMELMELDKNTSGRFSP